MNLINRILLLCYSKMSRFHTKITDIEATHTIGFSNYPTSISPSILNIKNYSSFDDDNIISVRNQLYDDIISMKQINLDNLIDEKDITLLIYLAIIINKNNFPDDKIYKTINSGLMACFDNWNKANEFDRKYFNLVKIYESALCDTKINQKIYLTDVIKNSIPYVKKYGTINLSDSIYPIVNHRSLLWFELIGWATDKKLEKYK